MGNKKHFGNAHISNQVLTHVGFAACRFQQKLTKQLLTALHVRYSSCFRGGRFQLYRCGTLLAVFAKKSKSVQTCHACTAILASPGCGFFPVRFTHSSHQQNAKQKQNGPLSLERVRPVRVLWHRDSPASTFPAGLPCGFWLWKDPRRYHVDDPRPCSQTWT